MQIISLPTRSVVSFNTYSSPLLIAKHSKTKDRTSWKRCQCPRQSSCLGLSPEMHMPWCTHTSVKWRLEKPKDFGPCCGVRSTPYSLGQRRIQQERLAAHLGCRFYAFLSNSSFCSREAVWSSSVLLKPCRPSQNCQMISILFISVFLLLFLSVLFWPYL